MAAGTRLRVSVAALFVLLASACGSAATPTETAAEAPASVGTPIVDSSLEDLDLPDRGPYTGTFQTICDYSHSLPDDPIVSPGVPGVSHEHDFFGSVAADAHLTYDIALENDSTCAIKQDTASYWTPAMYVDGEQVTPLTSLAYYQVADGVSLLDLEPFPAGLMMVAGDQGATEPQDGRVVGWSCGSSPHITPEPGDCANTVNLRLVFPDCWNGTDLRMLDNTHVAYSGDDGCPASHPVAMPTLEFSVSYPPVSPSAEVRLASGSPLTAHGDFFNAWNQKRLTNEVQRCLQRNVYC